VKDAGSYLKDKKCVNMHPFPLPFAIYAGMLEDVYCIANSVAFTSVCSPGMYGVMRHFIAGLPGTNKLVLDDLLGLCIPVEGSVPAPTYSTWTRQYITLLTSYGRLPWLVPGEEMTTSAAEDAYGDDDKWDVVANVTPLHYLHTMRLGLMGADKINANRHTCYIIPAGTADKVPLSSAYAKMYIKRRSLVMRIPSAIVDDHWIVVPPVGRRDFPVYPGAHLSELDSSLPVVQADKLDRQHEENFFSALYG